MLEENWQFEAEKNEKEHLSHLIKDRCHLRKEAYNYLRSDRNSMEISQRSGRDSLRRNEICAAKGRLRLQSQIFEGLLQVTVAGQYLGKQRTNGREDKW